MSSSDLRDSKDGLDLVGVPAGDFWMGGSSDLEDPCDLCDDGPYRRLWLPGFWMMRVPVTVAQWLQFLEESKYVWRIPDEAELQKSEPRDSLLHDWYRSEVFRLPLPVLLGRCSPRPDFPVTYVSWHDCTAFAEWKRKTSGRPYALPTEAQWEKACRGPDGESAPWGPCNDLSLDDLLDDVETQAWREPWKNEPWFDDPLVPTRPVGQTPQRSSPYGALDMWYNVAEWCDSWFVDAAELFEDEELARNPRGPGTGQLKVIKGGNPTWDKYPRCSARLDRWPEWRMGELGFRLVLNEDPAR